MTGQEFGTKLARMVLEQATNGEDALGPTLRKIQPPEPDGEIRFWTETIILTAYPVDLFLSMKCPDDMSPGEALRKQLLGYVNDMHAVAGLDALAPTDWRQLLATRFAQYHGASADTDSQPAQGAAPSKAMAKFGEIACQHIYGRPQVNPLVASTVVFRHFLYLRYLLESAASA
jgi:hypothetical protein